MKVTVIGCGRWGSLIAWYLDSIGHAVTLYGRENSQNMKRFLAERKNSFLTLPDSVTLCTDLKTAADDCETVVVSVGSQDFRGAARELDGAGLRGKTVVLCMKGIEISTGKRLSQVAGECLDKSNGIAVWLGPGHVQEFYAGHPNCMVIDSDDDDVKRRLVDSFSSELIRFYYGTDLIGNEIGAAMKNVIGIAAGMLDGLGLTSLKGALMSRGTIEVSRMIEALGGDGRSAYGLCHLGDYEATVFSPFSHNRAFGEAFIKGGKFSGLAEGYYTAEAAHLIGERYSIDLPICSAVYDILYNGADVKTELNRLFTRSIKEEF